MSTETPRVAAVDRNGGERQPLLAPPTDIHQQPSNDEESNISGSLEDLNKPQATLSGRDYLFYGTILLLGTATLALLIKLFIDSGDADVRAGRMRGLAAYLDTVRFEEGFDECPRWWSEWCCWCVTVRPFIAKLTLV